MSILEVIVLAIVEGITEFLPVSSTGHMIITSSLLNIPKDDFLELFLICIQLGAILAVDASRRTFSLEFLEYCPEARGQSLPPLRAPQRDTVGRKGETALQPN